MIPQVQIDQLTAAALEYLDDFSPDPEYTGEMFEDQSAEAIAAAFRRFPGIDSQLTPAERVKVAGVIEDGLFMVPHHWTGRKEGHLRRAAPELLALVRALRAESQGFAGCSPATRERAEKLLAAFEAIP